MAVKVVNSEWPFYKIMLELKVVKVESIKTISVGFFIYQIY